MSSGSPTEVALLVLAHRAGMPPSALLETYEKIREFPFDSTIKRVRFVPSPIHCLYLTQRDR